MDVDIRLRDGEAETRQPFQMWDTAFNADQLDWALAGPTEEGNAYGLRSLNGLHTSIIIQLATWKRADPTYPLPSGADPQGWWGDTVDIAEGESPIGSHLWLLYRSTLNDNTRLLAETYAREALQPFVKQGAVARFDVSAVVDKARSALAINIQGYSKAGQLVYSQKFTRLWEQIFTSNSGDYSGDML